MLPSVFLCANLSLGTTTPTLSRLEISQKKTTFCRKPTPEHTTRYFEFFVTHPEGFILNTGNKNLVPVDEHPPFIQCSISSSLFFDCVKNEIYFPPQND